MGTGCSTPKHVQHSTQNVPQQPGWSETEPIHRHNIAISQPTSNTQYKLYMSTNDSVHWTFTPGLISKWRVIEVFKSGQQYAPIQGGTNFVLDEDNSEFETIFHFPIRLTFAVIENAVEFNPNVRISYFINVMVLTRNPIKCAVTDAGFEYPYLIGHIGLPVVFTWKNLTSPISIARGEIDLELQVFRNFTHYDFEVGRSGQITFTPSRSGVSTFAIFIGTDFILDICSLRSYSQTLSHLVEIRDEGVEPLVSEIITGIPVLFHLSETEITFTDDSDFNSEPMMKRPYFYRTFSKPGIYNFATVGETNSTSGFLIVQSAPKRHEIIYSRQGFDSVILECKVGDFLCFNSQSKTDPPLLSVTTARTRQSNNQDLFILSGRLMEKIFAGRYIEYRVLNLGVHLFKTEQKLIAIASASNKTHNIMVNQTGFAPQNCDITLGDSILWYWGKDASSHNIVQVSFDGERIHGRLSPINNGYPSSNSGFHQRFDKLGNFYFISEGHDHPVRGEIIVWPATKVHTIICSPSIVLKPKLLKVCVNDWIVWVCPPHLQIEVVSNEFEFSDYVTQLSQGCSVLNVSVQGLLQFLLNVRFVEMENAPVVPIPYFIVSDQILAQNTILLPLFLARNERYLNPGDFLVLCSNFDSKIEVSLNSNLVVMVPITITLNPLELIMVTFWKEGMYQLEFMNQLIVVKISHDTCVCPTPNMPIVEWNEAVVGDSVYFETGQNIIYTLDGSCPISNSPDTQVMSENAIKFHSEGFVVMRVVAFDEDGCINSKIHTSQPLRISDRTENRIYQPKISFEPVTFSSARVQWRYPREGVEHIFKHVVTHRDMSVPLNTYNSCILKDLTSGNDEKILLEIFDIGSDILLESATFKFEFPFYEITTVPEVSIGKDSALELVRISWQRQTNSIPVVREYTVHVDDRLNCCIPAEFEEGPFEKGDESKCVVFLEDLEEGEVYVIQVSALATSSDGTTLVFESPQLTYNHPFSKSLSTESPKISSTDIDGRSFSVESDDICANDWDSMKIGEHFGPQGANFVQEDIVVMQNNIHELSVGREILSHIQRTISQLSTSTMTPIIESELENDSHELAPNSERCENSRTASLISLVGKNSSVNSVNKQMNEYKIEFLPKDFAISFIEVCWKISDGNECFMKINLERTMLELNGVGIFSGSASVGDFIIKEFETGLVNCVSLVAIVDEENTNPVRLSKNIFFAKSVGIQPVSLKPNQNFKNSVKLIAENDLSLSLDSLDLRFTKQTEFFRSEIGQNSSQIKPNKIHYHITCISPDGQSCTFEGSTSDEMQGTPYLTFFENEIILFNSKLGHSYTLSTKVLYPEHHIDTSNNILYILPIESPSYVVNFTTPGPPIPKRPILTSFNRSAIHIQWEEATIVTAPILGYVVFINETAFNEIITFSHLSFSLNNPTPGMKYVFTILALTNHPCGNSNGISYTESQPIEAYDSCNMSDPLEFEFSGILPLPLVQKVIPCFGTSVKVFWKVERKNGVFLVPDSFALLWKPVEDPLECDMKRIVYKSIDEYSYKLLGLLPWTLYKLEITVFHKNRNGEFIEAKTEPFTFMSPGPPLPPLNLNPDILWFDRIRVKWDSRSAELIKLVSWHIWAFVYYENKVFVRFEKVNFTQSHFEMDDLKSNTAYFIEFYSVRDDLKLIWEKSSDPIEAYEMKSRILLSLHTAVRLDVRTLSLDLNTQLQVTSNEEGEVLVVWGQIKFPESVKLFSYTLECCIGNEPSDIHCEETSNQPQILDLDKIATDHVFKNLPTGLIYQILLHCNLLQPDEPSEMYRVLLVKNIFRLPAPPEKPILFLSEINPSTLMISWNKSLTHQSIDGNIRSIFKGYRIYVNGTSQRILNRNTTKYSVCVNRTQNSLFEIKLVALGRTSCRANNEKMLVFDEENESESLLVDFRNFAQYFVFCSMHYIDLKGCADQSDSVLGCVNVSWRLNLSNLKDLMTIKLIWWYKNDDYKHETVLTNTQTEFQIENPIPKLVCVVQICLNFAEKTIFSPIFHSQISSPPEPPFIQFSDIPSPRGVNIKWHEPRQYCDFLICGYQMYSDDIVIGPELQPINFEAFLPIKASENYNLKLQALVSEEIPKRIFSNIIQTLVHTKKHPKNGVARKNIDAFLKEVKSQSIEVGWNYYTPEDRVPNHFRVEWSSISHPIPKVSKLTHTISYYTIRECVPGAIYFIHVKAMAKSDKLIATSSQIKIQTPATPSMPRLSLKEVTSNKIHLEWKHPIEYGDATVTGFVLFIDQTDSVEIDSGANSFSYDALPCREYFFRLQALTNHLVGNSKLSNNLIIETSGLKVPTPKQISSGKLHSIAVAMDTVVKMGNVKVEKIDVFCAPKNEFFEKIENYLLHPDCIAHVDLAPDTRKDTFHSLMNQSDFVVFIRATDNLGAEYYSEIIQMSVAITPDPPIVFFTNLSLNKRTNCIGELLNLINERDSLLLKLCWQQTKRVDTRTPKGQKICQEIAELSSELLKMEKSISVMLKYLQSHSMLISVLLRWEVVVDTPEVLISGYQVCVNGNKHMNLSSKQTNCSVEVNKNKYPESVSICVRACTEHPIGVGEVSESLSISWEKDFPSFSSFCLKNCHSEASVCCYLPSFEAECSHTKLTLKELTTRGYFDKQEYTQNKNTHNTKVWNVSKERIEIFPPKSENIIVALFFTIWCKSSIKLLELFTEFAECHSTEMKLVCVCINSGDSHVNSNHTNALSIVEQTTTSIEFFCACGQCLKPNPVDVYSIIGVPTFAVFYSNGSLAWLGRHASKDFSDFESFLIHTTQRVLDNRCSTQKCQYCMPKQRPITSAYSIASEDKRSIKSGALSRSISTPSTAKSRQLSSHPFSVYTTQSKPKPAKK
ncbi:hypothetical protein LOD99_3797 [Oopsacas minuta]|uniref:Fibronectin type-III domain-containing protein n=1 Tax=Oopsacas minuta TaxID=111878 RepID=A0AAV7JWQ2_9METZ|nr:hypothetical protein LOD99_3797 [Oopsacas minuta]